jgi:hypothetical protein
LFHLLDHLGSSFIPDVCQFLLVLNALHLGVFIVLLIFGVAAGFVLELGIGLHVIAAGKLEERVEVELGDGFFLVEIQLFKDRHDAVLDGGEPKDLHADVVYDLAFVEISEGWRQLGLSTIGL